MKKFNVLTALLLFFWSQICFSEKIPDDYYLSISDDEGYFEATNDSLLQSMGIDRKYELYLKSSGNYPAGLFETAPFHASNGDGVVKRHETQGLANIDGKYWILAKNKWMDVFENDSSWFSEENKVANITLDKEKNGDIDFFENKLYAPIKKEIYVYDWNKTTRKFTKEENPYPLEEYLERYYEKVYISGENFIMVEKYKEPFGVTIHPYSGDIFLEKTAKRVRVVFMAKSFLTGNATT